jgi:hypothetical protein
VKIEINKPWETCQYVFQLKGDIQIFGKQKTKIETTGTCVLKGGWVDKTRENKYYQLLCNLQHTE